MPSAFNIRPYRVRSFDFLPDRRRPHHYGDDRYSASGAYAMGNVRGLRWDFRDRESL